jgi:hypothetical protein
MGFLQHFSPRRAPILVRLLLCALTLAGLLPVAGVLRESVHEVRGYRQAPVCIPGAFGSGCVIETLGTIVDGKSERAVASTLGDTRIVYRLQISHLRTEWLQVDREMYSGVYINGRVRVRIWRGVVVGLEAGDRTRAYVPPTTHSVGWYVTFAWLLLGLLIWAALSGYLDTLYLGLGWVVATLAVIGVSRGVLFGFAEGRITFFIVFGGIMGSVLWLGIWRILRRGDTN